MDKRLGLALAISMVILFGWWKLFPPPHQEPAARPTASESKSEASPGATAPTTAAAAAANPAAAANAAPANAPEERPVLETPGARFVLSSWGGTLRAIELKEQKFKGLQIVRTQTPETAALRITFPKADAPLPQDGSYTVSRPSADTVVFRSETDAAVVEKRYHLGGGRFVLGLDVTIQNKLDKPLGESMAVHLYGRQDPDKKGGSFLSYASADLSEMVCYVGDKAERANIETLVKESKENLGNVRWIAADEKFFTIALVPHPETPLRDLKCGRRALDTDTGEVFVSLAGRSIAPHEKTTHSFTIYGGPKYRSDLDQVWVNGQDSQLVHVVNVTLAVLSRPLLFMLRVFHGLTGNWGFAIILLTIFVKLLTFYPTQRTMLSAKKMQKLAPKMAALRKKYENDRQKMGVETMALYKAHGVSPFGGCLPSLIQLPIWMALFSTLNYSVELHRSGFLGYIHDLSAKDPYYVTPLLMGAVMFLQMRMSPAGADPQQQKMMSVMMPIMFTVFSLFLPAGLAIYTLTSYLIGILQQLLVNYLDRRSSGGAVPAKA